MKTNLMFTMLLLSVLGLVAQAAIVRSTEDAKYPGSDTYVTNDNNSQGPNSNFGTATNVRGWRQLAATRCKIGYVRFNISEVTGDLSGATITLQLLLIKGGASTISVYGVNDGPDDFWIESGTGGITYNTAPGLAAATAGNYALDLTKATLLGTFTSPAAPSPIVYPIPVVTSPATLDLTAFLNADTNGLVTFFFIGPNDEDEFASKEHATFTAPTLTMSNASVGGAINPQPQSETSVNRNALTQLSWTLIPGIAKCDVYFGTDPNILNPAMKKLSFAPAVESVNIADIPGFSVPLPDGKYYWRVDCYDKLVDPNTLIGPFWSFTATSAPVFKSITPAAQGKFEGQGADPIIVVFESTSAMNYAWYRSVDNDNSTDADDAPVGGNSDTLSLSSLTAGDEGWYYCKASGPGGETRSGLARLTIKRLLAYWTLDGNAADSSPAKLDGTLMGEPAFGAGVNEKTGQALQLDGVDDFVDLPDDFSDFSAGLTIAVWANPAAVGSWARFVDFGNGAGSDNVYLARNGTSNNLSFSFYKGANSAIQVTANNALVLNAWQMFVATMDEAGNIVLYKNGLPIQTGTVAVMPNIVTRTGNFIGDSNWTDDALYNGAMDDIRIFNYAVSADTVADLYSAVAGNFCRTPLALDYDGNCKVDLPDLATFAADWLKCGLYPACP
jgi:hypothetical protein